MQAKHTHLVFLPSNDTVKFTDNEFNENGIKSVNFFEQSPFAINALGSYYQDKFFKSDKEFPKYMHVRFLETLDNGVQVLTTDYKCYRMTRKVHYSFDSMGVDPTDASEQIDLFEGE